MRKSTKITFWITTILIGVTQGIMPIFSTHSELTVEVITGLGYPVYFILMLNIFKLLGGLVLLIPFLSNRLKEWAYAGFTFDFIAAFVSLLVVEGVSIGTFVPVVTLTFLMVSYITHHKMISAKKETVL